VGADPEDRPREAADPIGVRTHERARGHDDAACFTAHSEIERSAHDADDVELDRGTLRIEGPVLEVTALDLLLGERCERQPIADPETEPAREAFADVQLVHPSRPAPLDQP
jgi:hypothetical protein